jgi:hypothetical protein
VGGDIKHYFTCNFHLAPLVCLLSMPRGSSWPTGMSEAQIQSEDALLRKNHILFYSAWETASASLINHTRQCTGRRRTSTAETSSEFPSWYIFFPGQWRPGKTRYPGGEVKPKDTVDFLARFLTMSCQITHSNLFLGKYSHFSHGQHQGSITSACRTLWCRWLTVAQIVFPDREPWEP